MDNHGSQSLAITCKICSADPKIYSAVFIVAPPTTLKSNQTNYIPKIKNFLKSLPLVSCLSGASRARRLRIRLWRNNKLSRQASKLRSRELSSSFFLSVFGRAAKGRHHYYRKTNRLEPLQQQRPTAITYWKVEDFLKVYRSTVHYSDYEFCQETWCAMRRVPWGLIALKGSAFYQSNIYKDLLYLRCIFLHFAWHF